jgi:hypothetical protein
MSAEAKKECDRELKRLAKMTPGVGRIHGVAHLPGMDDRAALEQDLRHRRHRHRQGQKILDEDHYDLKKVKQRILDYLAVKKAAAGNEGADPVLRRASWAWARPRWGNRLPARWAANSCASRWAACTTKRKSAAIAALTSARCRGRSFKACAARDAGSGVHAGRGGQARPRFPRRSVRGVDGSARSGTELDVPRSLPRRAFRSFQGAVHRHGQLDRSDSGAAAGPHGNSRTWPATPRKKKSTSPSGI